MERVNQPYKIKGTMVQGQGYSYNLTSKIDAEKLSTTLNHLHLTRISYIPSATEMALVNSDTLTAF